MRDPETMPYRKVMKRLELVFIATLTVLILFAAALASSPLCAEQRGLTPNRQDPGAEALWRRLQQVDESLEAVRRDQLNYKLEKDLLKEAYASNLQTINIVITLVLATLAVLGFIGVRSIAAIRQEFRNELQRLSGLRSQFEDKFREIDSSLARTQKKFEEIASVNEEQEQRLRVLEIQEKASSLIQSRNYQRALEYLNVGLSLSADDGILLGLQAQSLTGLGRLAEALKPTERMLALDPSDITTISNAAELYLLNLRFGDAEALYQQHRETLTSRYGPYALWYFTALKYFLEGDEDQLRRHVATHPVESPAQKEPRIRGWHFTEARNLIASRPESRLKELMLKVLEFMEGNLSLEELQKLVNARPA